MQTVCSSALTNFKKRKLNGFKTMVLGLAALIVASVAMPAVANAETRTLRMYFTHTKKSTTFTFKRNGRYIKGGLRKANNFLRDWRRKESTKMDPELLDLVWEVYQKSGSRKPIHVISGYRSPRTNNMLRRRGRKVARKSQHTRGKALDFFLPDVSVKKLRALGLKAHRGGVGYYRGSFVHLDTGNVRHWPRMSRRQLARVFPRGKTIHVPSNGKALRGYKVAKANLKRGLNADGSKRRTKVRTSLLARLFNRSTSRGGDEDEGTTVTTKPTVASAKPAPKKKPRVVAKAKKSAVDPFAAEAARVEKSANAAKIKRLADEKQKAAEAKLANEKKLAAEKAKNEKLRNDKRLQQEKEDEAKAIALAAAAEEALQKQQEQTELAALVPNRITRPRSRPALRTSTTLALAPVTDNGSAAKATELALVTPSQAPRPLVDIAEPAGTSATAALKDVDALRGRVKTALANAKPLENLLVPIQNAPLPKVAQRQPVQTAETAEENFALPDENSVSVPVPRSSQQQGESVLQASLQPELTLSRPTLRAPQKAPAINARSVPTPPKPVFKKRQQANDRAISTGLGTSMEAELSLGNLDGRSVKTWAVATSTRIGSSAVLKAPRYRASTKRAAPASVYSIGFEDETSPLRADRFSGRALTRVAFANFSTGR